MLIRQSEVALQMLLSDLGLAAASTAVISFSYQRWDYNAATRGY
jgi:hypothetical protein